MHPVLVTIGGFDLHTYGVLGAAGFLLVCAIALVRGRHEGLSVDRLVDLIFWTSLAGVVGARALYLLQNPDYATGGPATWLRIRDGGMVFYGAVLAGLPSAALLIRRYGLPFHRVMDVFATALPLGHAVTRLGCFAAGCCHGTPTDVPWAVTFDHPLTVAPKGVPLHPTQLYEVAYLLGIFLVVNAWYPRRRFPGRVMLLYLALYAVLRAINEVFRGDETRGWFLEGLLGQTLSTSQGISLLLAGVALSVFLLGARRQAAAGAA